MILSIQHSVLLCCISHFYNSAECHFLMIGEYYYPECHYTEGHNTECSYSECHYLQCHYSENHYSKCHYSECHYSQWVSSCSVSLWWLSFCLVSLFWVLLCWFSLYWVTCILSLFMLSVIRLSVIMMSVIAPTYFLNFISLENTFFRDKDINIDWQGYFYLQRVKFYFIFSINNQS